MSTSGLNSPHFRFNNLHNDREKDRKPSFCREIAPLDLISGSKMSTSGYNSPHFQFNNLHNDREEDRKPSICREIAPLDLISGSKIFTWQWRGPQTKYSPGYSAIGPYFRF